MNIDIATLVDGGGVQVDRWTMAMLFEHSVVTWVAFCSTRIGRGFDNEFSGTGS